MATMQKTNPQGLALIKKFEGLRLHAYRCPADILTIGYGHTGPDVHEGQTLTEAQAEALLKQDLAKFEELVGSLLWGADTTSNQFSAMVALTYNIGAGHFKASSVLSHHRERRYAQAASSFKLWNKGGGHVLPGLVARRAAEQALYETL